MFKVIADFLTTNGIAVLRMDDRGVGESSGPHVRNSTTKERANDAISAFQFLKEQENIDDSKIGLIGHSEGTYTATLVANAIDDVKFIAMISPFAIAGDELWSWQQGNILRREGEFSEKKIQSIEKELFNMVNHIGQENTDEGFFKFGRAACLAWGDPPEEVTNEFVEEVFGDLRQRWYEHFFGTNPANEIIKIKVPLLAIFGSADVQTPPQLNLNYLNQALIAGGHNEFTIVVLPNEDHFFMKGEGLPPNEHVLGNMHLSELFLVTLRDWLRQKTTAENQ